MRVGLAADHQGYALKKQILNSLREASVETVDYGALALNPADDYPKFVAPLALAVSRGEVDRGIAICGSGIGACIVSNKIRNVRAGLVHDAFSVIQGVEDDDMNIICFGAQLVKLSLALELIHYFLGAHFSDLPRHKRRLAEISKLEKMETSK